MENKKNKKAAVLTACFVAISLICVSLTVILFANQNKSDLSKEANLSQNGMNLGKEQAKSNANQTKSNNRAIEKPYNLKFNEKGVDSHTAVLTVDRTKSFNEIASDLKPYFSEKNINLALQDLGNLSDYNYNPAISISAKSDLNDLDIKDLQQRDSFVSAARELEVKLDDYSQNPNDLYNLSDSASYAFKDYNQLNPGASSVASAWQYLNGKNVASKNQVPIAVIDSGFTASPGGESDNIIAKCDFGEGAADCSKTTVDPSPQASPSQAPNHGTVTSQIISSSTNNAIGGMGVSYDSPVYFYKVSTRTGNLSNSAIVNAINKAADDGAKVINMSFGAYCDNCSPDGDTLAPWSMALKEAYEKGVTPVASAGNGRAKHGYTCHQNTPALLNVVISVAATDIEGKPSYFTDCGETVNVAAAGVDVRTVTNPRQIELSEDWQTGNGTSYSAPVVSGAAAVLQRININLTPGQIIDILEKTAHDVTKFSGISGDICNIEQGVHIGKDICTGYGIIDLNEAAKEAASKDPTPSPIPTPSPVDKFTDIASDSQYEDIVWMLTNGFADGYLCFDKANPYKQCQGKDTKIFMPKNALTRGHIVTFLWKFFGKPYIDPAWTSPFVDIENYAEKDKVIWAYHLGLTKGADAKHFSPQKNVTRYQAAQFLYNAAGKPIVKEDSVFVDINSTSPSYEAIIWAASKGIYTGYVCEAAGLPSGECQKAGDRLFKGAHKNSRGQLAKILHQYYLA
ncbi:MAG: S8 family serine peptidase [Bifidobacteriaceae bacterium]|nr:S8 family serine peptidase [Bifidobacteriaceae bacterium]